MAYLRLNISLHAILYVALSQFRKRQDSIYICDWLKRCCWWLLKTSPRSNVGITFWGLLHSWVYVESFHNRMFYSDNLLISLFPSTQWKGAECSRATCASASLSCLYALPSPSPQLLFFHPWDYLGPVKPALKTAHGGLSPRFRMAVSA